MREKFKPYRAEEIRSHIASNLPNATNNFIFYCDELLSYINDKKVSKLLVVRVGCLFFQCNNFNCWMFDKFSSVNLKDNATSTYICISKPQQITLGDYES